MDRLRVAAAMPAELAERLSDVGREWTMAERQEIERETEKRIAARLSDPQFWADGLDGIEETKRTARLLAQITNERLGRAMAGQQSAAIEILTAIWVFGRDTIADLRDGITEEVEAEMANGGIES